MINDRKRKFITLPVVASCVVVLDQLTKWIVLKQMALYQTIPVIPGLFNLTHVHNPGGAFGFMANQSSGVRIFLFIVISLLAAGFVLYLYLNTPPKHAWLLGGLSLIFGGAIGNLIDRIRFGTVVDFLDFYIADMHWPAFNVADSGISVGMTILVFHILFRKVPL